MAFHEDNEDPFDVCSIWQTPKFSIDVNTIPSELFSEPALNLESLRLTNPYAPHQNLAKELRLPELESLEPLSAGEISQPLESAPSSREDEELQSVEDAHSIWDDELNFVTRDKENRLFTWEAFEAQRYDAPNPFFLSESGDRAFDAILQELDFISEIPAEQAVRVLPTNELLKCLFALGMGRSSVLFQYDDTTGRFVQVMDHTRMTGLSNTVTTDLVATFLDCANGISLLKGYVRRSFEHKGTISARVALASAISTITTTMEASLQDREYGSALQLEQLFELPFLLVGCLCAMVKAAKGTASNSKMVDHMYHAVERMEHGDSRTRTIAMHVLDQVARPWLQEVEQWVGLRSLNMLTLQFDSDFLAVQSTRKLSPDSNGKQGEEVVFTYEPTNVPTFVASTDGELLFETGSAMQFLHQHHPNHPLCSAIAQSLSAPDLEWHWSWADLDRVAAKANAYEHALRQIVDRCDPELPPVTAALPPLLDDDSSAAPGGYNSLFDISYDVELQTLETPNLLPTSSQQSTHRQLEIALATLFDVNCAASSERFPDAFEPPLSISPQLSFMPILRAQSRVVNTATLRLFFEAHDLRRHFDLQRQYHLLGDGVFVSRLSSALFSPELKTAERRKGVMRTGATMGLRLGSRKTWPPASSELQLALAGILNECYASSRIFHSHTERGRRSHTVRNVDDLPGKLSFSVRQLPEEEIDKVMDSQSLYALDFLRLQYSPPSPIDLVITESALEKYDNIFKTLLRIMRMLFILNHLHRNTSRFVARKFRIEAIHFITTITAYFFDCGIRDKWDAFSAFVNKAEAMFSREDHDEEHRDTMLHGLGTLRQAHEACLDRIMFTLFLRKRHEKVMQLLEEIFGQVLEFAANYDDEDYDVAHVHSQFHSNVKIFVDVCRGLRGKKRKGQSAAAEGDEHDIERLLVNLDISGFYGNE